jgi:hypothetical protein
MRRRGEKSAGRKAASRDRSREPVLATVEETVEHLKGERKVMSDDKNRKGHLPADC